MKRRSLIITMLLAAGAAALLCVIFPPHFSYGDLVQYWAASVLFLGGENPYDTARRLEVVQSVAVGTDVPPLYAPPPILLFYCWFGVLPYGWLAFIWRLLTICGLVLSLRMLGVRHVGLIGAAALVSFVPALQTLIFGQLGMPPLLGLIGFLVLRRRRAYLAGALLALSTLRFQLFAPLYLTLLFERRATALILGFATGAAVLWGAPLAVAPGLYETFFSTRPTPLYWNNPVAGMFLQRGIDAHQPLWRLVPQALAVMLIVIRYGMGKREPSYERTILPLCLIAAPYAWSYDFLFLLPAVALLITASPMQCSLTLVFNALLLFSHAPNQLSFWYPPAVALALSPYISQDFVARRLRRLKMLFSRSAGAGV